MNICGDLCDVWGTAMFRATWQAGLAVLVVWVICLAAPSLPARVQTWLWRCALLKFLVVLGWSMPIPVPLLPATPAPLEVVIREATLVAPASSVADQLAPSVTSRSPWRLAFLVWLGVVGWLAARIFIAWCDTCRLRKSSRRTDDVRLLEQLSRLAKSVGLRTRPALMETPGEGSPLLLGIFRPAIVLPSATLGRLNQSERELVLGHELAHLYHGDLLWSLVAAGVRCVFFFHPAAWLCERRLRWTQEVAADELTISLRGECPANYARQLLQVISKLGPDVARPALSVGIAGPNQSLQQRFTAMRFIKPVSPCLRIAYGWLLGIIVLPGVVPWVLVAAEPAITTPLKSNANVEAGVAVEPAQPANQSQATGDEQREAPVLKQGKGKFVSFQEGTLTLDGPAGPLVWNHIDERTRAFLAAGEDIGKDRGYRPTATLEALGKVKPGTPVFVGSWFGYEQRHGVFIGVNRATTVGTFVSFKDGSLSLLARERAGGSFTKKYGNSIFLRNLPPKVPVEESVDGGEYQSLGTAKEVLPHVGEGTLVTVHFLGEGNITLIQLGQPRTK